MRFVALLTLVVGLCFLAGRLIPQFTHSGEAAKLSQLDRNLTEMRGAVELYYHQHNSTYPGANRDFDGTATRSALEAATAFVAQTTNPTDVNGYVHDGFFSPGVSRTGLLNPYLKNGIPVNPFNGLNTVVCDLIEDDMTKALADGTSGWKFYIKRGFLIANDGTHDTR